MMEFRSEIYTIEMNFIYLMYLINCFLMTSLKGAPTLGFLASSVNYYILN